jgi:hypothetical protein
MLLQQIINGLTAGSVYALIALGYTMIYGILGLINFAQGEIYMAGAFAAVLLLHAFKVNFFLAFVFGMGVAALVGVLLERLAFRFSSKVWPSCSSARQTDPFPYILSLPPSILPEFPSPPCSWPSFLPLYFLWPYY